MKHFANTAAANLARRLSFGSLMALAIVIVACGRDTKVYPDPAPASTVSIIDGTSLLPKGFYDQSVNSGVVDVGLDGETAKSTALRFRTQPVTNNIGGFNGNGLGNRALLGLDNYDSQALSSLQPLNFDVSYYGGGTASMSLVLIADLNCDDTNVKVLVADAYALSQNATSIDALYNRLNANFDQSVWRASTAAINDSNGNEVLPSAASGNVSTLTALLSAYPNACLINTTTTDPGLPAGLPTAGLLFSLGSQDTTSFNGAFVAHMTIGSTDYDFTKQVNQ